MRQIQADKVTGPYAHHGEGPVWSTAWQGLRWVDMLTGSLLTLRYGEVSRLGIDSPIAAFVRPRTRGGYVVGTEKGIALSDSADAVPEHSIQLWDSPDIRMNDGTVTPDGRLLAGSMAYDASSEAASLHMIEPSLTSRVELSNVTVSNGVDFSPDGLVAYYVDSTTYSVQAFDYRDGRLIDGRMFVQVHPADGMPDGLTVAADGSVWIALWGGGAVHGYSPQGALHTVVEVPVSQVSACTFGGEGLDVLFMTTSRQGLRDEEQPEAGSLFSACPGPVGMPVRSFDG